LGVLHRLTTALLPWLPSCLKGTSW
jgi:hypothetical protein